MQIVVFKVGGSLLDLAGLGNLLEKLIAERPNIAPLLVVGGGAAADLVRQWDQAHDLGRDRAHWLAVRAMRLNEALLQEILPRCVRVASRQEIITESSNGFLPLLDTMRFLKADERHADALPHCWDVTSDSIAAQAAIRFEADELVLGKSASLSPKKSLSDAHTSGFLDGHFHHLAGQIPKVSWVNLRESRDSTHPVVMPWLSFGETQCDRERPLGGAGG